MEAIMKGKATISAAAGLLLSGIIATSAYAVAEQKPTIVKTCSIAGCHSPQPNVLRGNAGSISGKAETIQINTGAVWSVKFGEDTKVSNWQQALNKIPKDKEIAITFIEKGGELYATNVSVKPPVKVDPAKLIKVDEVKKLVEAGKTLIIDARPAPRYNEGHIPSAINIWDANFDKNTDKLPKEKGTLIVYYCAGPTCALTPSSAKKAEKLGYTNVKMFVDGMPEWKKHGNPVASNKANLKELIEKDIPHVLIDVRAADIAVKGHIKGAVNIPLKELEALEDKFPAQKNAPIIIYCDLEKLSQDAFKIVRKWGYSNASYLAGGIDGWEKAGNSVFAGELKQNIVYVPKPRPGEIAVEEFMKIAESIAADKLILDVRDEDEAAEGMIKGAKNIPTQDVGKRVAEIPKDREIIAHCSTGVRAEIAYNVLKDAGYKVRFLNANMKVDKSGKYEIAKE
jgi:rhodanese-related sulfurtransferase